MSNEIKITMPPLREGQDGWDVRPALSLYPPPRPDTRAWYERAAYAVLMWAHDRAEDLWHWCYSASRKYAPPMDAGSAQYVAGGMYGFSVKHVPAAPSEIGDGR